MGELQTLMDDGGQVTMGAVGEISAASVASMSQGMLAGPMRRNGESGSQLLLCLDGPSCSLSSKNASSAVCSKHVACTPSAADGWNERYRCATGRVTPSAHR